MARIFDWRGLLGLPDVPPFANSFTRTYPSERAYHIEAGQLLSAGWYAEHEEAINTRHGCGASFVFALGVLALAVVTSFMVPCVGVGILGIGGIAWLAYSLSGSSGMLVTWVRAEDDFGDEDLEDEDDA